MHFSHGISRCVSVGLYESSLCGPGVKINGQYYLDTLLMSYLLPDIKQSSLDYFTFQQDSAQGT